MPSTMRRSVPSRKTSQANSAVSTDSRLSSSDAVAALVRRSPQLAQLHIPEGWKGAAPAVLRAAAAKAGRLRR